MTYNRQDHLYQKAKAEGYRSRAAYKLLELNEKFHLLRSGARVLDLGCWPGGWVQVAATKVGPGGRVVGIDLQQTEPIGRNNTFLIEGDAREESVLEEATRLAGGKFDIVLSDMSPKHSGIKEVDQAGTAHSVELAFWVAGQLLKSGGGLVVKAFPSGDLDRFIPELRKHFHKVQRTVLKSTRKTSKEFYIYCNGFKGS